MSRVNGTGAKMKAQRQVSSAQHGDWAQIPRTLELLYGEMTKLGTTCRGWTAWSVPGIKQGQGSTLTRRCQEKDTSVTDGTESLDFKRLQGATYQ